MTDVPVTAAPNEHPLGPPRSDWPALGTLHVRLTFTATPKGNVVFDAEKRWRPETDWREALKNILSPNKPKSLDIRPTPWDFTVRRNCWVLIELDHGNWQFSRKKKGITLKEKGHAGLYFGLVHAYAHDDATDGIPPKNGCRFAAFGAEYNVKKDRQSFNIHTQFVTGLDSDLVVDWDPDIRNQGDPTGEGEENDMDTMPAAAGAL